jgi:predicted 3-demethylubiquinone-9 3-methyltransferase (glyoxalase superfamily)
MPALPKITTFLTFVGQAEAAATFYTSIFPASKIVAKTYYGPDQPMPEGTVLTVDFELLGQAYVALNGPPHFKFTDAISLSVEVDTQEEIDGYTQALLAGGGTQGPCGWLTDRFGVSWQMNPSAMRWMMQDPDKTKVARVMQAMMKMRKIDLAALTQAFEG